MSEEAAFVPAEMGPREAYRLLASLVVPRPIGWISTISPDGVPNLAPYSFFNGVGAYPPTVMFSAGQRLGPKDTLRNARETGEFVVNIVSDDLAGAMNLTAGDWPYEVSEFDAAGLAAAPCIDVKPPRVASARAALECRVTQIVPVEGTHYTAVFGRVVRFHVRADLLRPDGLVDPERLQPVGRLGGDAYARLGEVFEMPRPTVR
ncbi:MAG: flavin reductase family protein [Anaerolineae bacterium]